jgi:hypothetical protein
MIFKESINRLGEKIGLNEPDRVRSTFPSSFRQTVEIVPKVIYKEADKKATIIPVKKEFKSGTYTPQSTMDIWFEKTKNFVRINLKWFAIGLGILIVLLLIIKKKKRTIRVKSKKHNPAKRTRRSTNPTAKQKRLKALAKARRVLRLKRKGKRK